MKDTDMSKEVMADTVTVEDKSRPDMDTGVDRFRVDMDTGVDKYRADMDKVEDTFLAGMVTLEKVAKTKLVGALNSRKQRPFDIGKSETLKKSKRLKKFLKQSICW
jgi:hypothetical protein